MLRTPAPTRRLSRFAPAALLACAAVSLGYAQFAELGPPPLAPDSAKDQGIGRRHATLQAAGWFDTSNRESVRTLYNSSLVPSRSVAMGWTGSVAGCAAGTTSTAFRDAVALRVNWFRGMSGVPAGVTLEAVWNAKDQDAALMMSANRQLSHSPPTTWACYTAAGAEAAGKSNLCYAYGSLNDPGCIELYMVDKGSGNTAVGHRRWILYPPTELMGTGDVTESGIYPTTNALWVINSPVPPRPATRDEFVAWPPKGYVPYQVVPARWSFSYPNANFGSATVSMTRGGAAVPVQLETVANGYGDNTLVWIADNKDTDSRSPWPKPASDTPINVTVSNVLINGQARSFTYQVIIFDPAAASAPAATPTAAFRDTNSSIRLTRQGSTVVYNAGGLFASDPSAAQNSAGDTFVVARDTYNSLWANVFSASTLVWGSWSYGGGVTKGMPAIAVATGGTAYIAARDNWDSYWLASYTAGGSFGGWTYLAGIFSTDPAMAACPDGSVYLVGKDNWGSLWSGRFIPGTGFQGWAWGQGIVKGKPSASCGTDNVVYVAARDNWDSLWMARVQGNSWLGWSYGGGIMSTDPQTAAAGNGTVYTMVQDSGGGVWYRGYTEGTSSGWQSWNFTNGVLQTGAPAASGGELYAAGRDGANNDLWWYRATGNQWTNIGSRGVAAGPLSAAPR